MESILEANRVRSSATCARDIFSLTEDEYVKCSYAQNLVMFSVIIAALVVITILLIFFGTAQAKITMLIITGLAILGAVIVLFNSESTARTQKRTVEYALSDLMRGYGMNRGGAIRMYKEKAAEAARQQAARQQAADRRAAQQRAAQQAAQRPPAKK
jgi:hypothetical protein